MKTFSRICLFVMAVLLVTACGPTPMPIPPVAIQSAFPATPMPPVGSPNDPATARPMMPAIQANNPFAPQDGDGSMMNGDIKIDSASLILTTSLPPQVMLNIAYFKPTPCFQLRMEVSQPDAQNRIDVKAYAVAEKNKACTLMALSTPIPANLDLGSFPKGHYSVWLNDVKVGEFDS